MKETHFLPHNSNMRFGLENGHWLLMFVLTGWEDLMMVTLINNSNVSRWIALRVI